MLELRVAALLVFASYLFTADCYILSKCNISVFKIFGYQAASTSSPLMVSNTLSIILIAGCLTVSAQTWLLPGINTRICGILTLVVVLIVILKQQRLGRVLRRVLRGYVDSENRLGDILVSDALVSLAPVLSDITLCVFLTLKRVPRETPLNRSALMNPLIPFTASIPSIIRMKQCFYEFRTTRNRQHVLNFLKYFVGNIVNAIRIQVATLKMFNAPADQVLQYERRIPYALFMGATYSLVWDIFVDWKMSRLFNTRGRLGLRLPHVLYYLAILVDTVLRFAFLASVPFEHVIFTLQALELFRRGVWVVFRTESEPPQELSEIEMTKL